MLRLSGDVDLADQHLEEAEDFAPRAGSDSLETFRMHRLRVGYTEKMGEKN